MNPQFPLYIVSKGRYESRVTAKHLERMKVQYNIVVEEAEAELYRAVTNPKYGNIIILDKKYQDDYDTFDDLGNTRSKGPGPARNFAWEHSKKAGHKWHWVMDDNIDGFYRLNNNLKLRVGDGTIFKCMEDWCLRYENVLMGGPNYFMFASRKSKMPPFVLNTRIYSCNLIRNDSDFRWRGRYNEDTDLSLRMLKAGYCTVQFNAFLQMKMPTQALKGGNTDAFYHKEGKVEKGQKYAKDGTLAKSEMQVKMHPDISKLVWKFGRWHHHVDYSRFMKFNKLKRKPDIHIKEEVNNYGMKLIEVSYHEESFYKPEIKEEIKQEVKPDLLAYHNRIASNEAFKPDKSKAKPVKTEVQKLQSAIPEEKKPVIHLEPERLKIEGINLSFNDKVYQMMIKCTGKFILSEYVKPESRKQFIEAVKMMIDCGHCALYGFDLQFSNDYSIIYKNNLNLKENVAESNTVDNQNEEQ